MTKYANLSTVQKWIKGNATSAPILQTAQSLSQAFLWSVRDTLYNVPSWWSKTRDAWLVDFWKRQGNDLLAGAMATMVSKIVATSWYVEGPEDIASLYRDILLYHTNFGAGWDEMCQQLVSAYLNRDFGGPLEHHRKSIGDHTGPALNFAYLDASKCLPNDDVEWPIFYDTGDKLRKMHRSQVSIMRDMPAGEESMMRMGFCSVGRCVATALVLMDIAKYKRERLSNLPPAGILFISNLTNTQWEDLSKKYDTRQRNEGMDVWRDLMVVCGVDPAHPTTADLFALSELPEHYDEKTSTEIAVYSFALAFRTDPREFWPVSSGPLGTATEASIQHKKAKAKGEGIIFTHIERILNSIYGLPQVVKFKFDYRDDEDDMMAAEIADRRMSSVRKMWESSPNRGGSGGVSGGIFGGRPQGAQDGEDANRWYRQGGDTNADDEGSQPRPVQPGAQQMEDTEQNEGIISTEEARQLLVLWNLVPAEVLGMGVDRKQVYDVRKYYGPTVRAYRDGRLVKCGA